LWARRNRQKKIIGAIVLNGLRWGLVFTELRIEPSAQLERHEEEGSIVEENNRLITFRLDTWQAIVDRLISIAGEPVTETLLSQIGNSIGRSGMEYSKNRILTEDDLWKVFDEVLRARGWGRCVGFSKGTGPRKSYIVNLRNAPLTSQRRAPKPTCYMMRGVVTGWLEAYSGAKATAAVEKSCAAMGTSVCVFEITF